MNPHLGTYVEARQIAKVVELGIARGAVHDIALVEEQAREQTAVLTGNAEDERSAAHACRTRLLMPACLPFMRVARGTVSLLGMGGSIVVRCGFLGLAFSGNRR